jgi:hypothetical protein
MSAEVNPAATHHVPIFITTLGQTDVLMVSARHNSTGYAGKSDRRALRGATERICRAEARIFSGWDAQKFAKFGKVSSYHSP